MSGFGTIVTGTIYEGAVSLGDVVELMPKGIRAKCDRYRFMANPSNGRKLVNARQ
jgi:sulfate adenylyltransferase subunit 1 (EFTu-like GTPase family)